MTTTAPTQPAAAPVVEPIRPLSELSSADVPFAGGKGANLGQLTRSGFPIAPGFVGGAPSVHSDYAELLVNAGIDAISVSADAVDRTRRLIAAAEQRLLLDAARLTPTTPNLGAGHV